ncbi:MAG: nonstructural protein [Microvirus sp.]|nr:MAG: nonstructural protein [Microvirus sp.]
MTKYAIVAIRDSAMDRFMPPAAMITTAQAIRGFIDEVNRQHPDNQIAKHPEDYELWMLATWDEESGLYQEQHPTCIARAKDYKENKQ